MRLPPPGRLRYPNINALQLAVANAASKPRGDTQPLAAGAKALAPWQPVLDNSRWLATCNESDNARLSPVAGSVCSDGMTVSVRLVHDRSRGSSCGFFPAGASAVR